MKIELVQVGRWRQVVQDRHLLERKEEEERLRSKVAEVRSFFYLSSGYSPEFVVIPRILFCFEKCWQMVKRCGLWHKLSSPPPATATFTFFSKQKLSHVWKTVFNSANFEKFSKLAQLK